MTVQAGRWQRVGALFDAAADLPPHARAAYLDRHCGDDHVLRAEVQALLAADAGAAMLDRPVAALIDVHVLTGRDGEPVAVPDPALGTRIGPYRLDAVLGRGGMGVVYAASRDDGAFAQRVAIKRLRVRWESHALAERFVLERRILASLSHPHIARLLDGGIDGDGQPWFAMEYIDGAPLTEWADAQLLDLRQRIALFGQVCQAVQHAHAHFVVHRDLKPHNILVGADGAVRVLDFGVAKLVDPLAAQLTCTGAAVGFTPAYAAPEQINGAAISAATDVYALGLVLYELVTGRLPYDLAGADLQARVEAISRHAPLRPELAIASGTPAQVALRLRQRSTDARQFRRDVRGDLTRILQTALAKESERRYASVQAMADDLARLVAGRPVSVAGDTLAYRTRKFVMRNRWGVAMASVAVLALLAGVVGIVLQAQATQRQAALAESRALRADAAKNFALQLIVDTNPTNAGFDGDVPKLLEEAARDVIERFHDEPALLAEIAHSLSSTMLDSDSRPEAERFIAQVQALLARNPDTPAWADDMLDVRSAQIALRVGDVGQAERLLQGVLEGLSEHDGMTGKILAEAYAIKASLRLAQMREQDARVEAETALRLARRWIGEGSQEAAHAKNSLLNVLRITMQPMDAAVAAQATQLHADVVGFFGVQHPVARRAARSMAVVEHRMQRHDEAERRLLALQQDAPDLKGSTTRVDHELAVLYAETNRFAEANAAYQRAADWHARYRAAWQQVVLVRHRDESHARYRQGDWARALALATLAADLWQELHGAHAPHVLSARAVQVDALVELGETTAAAALLRDLLPRLQAARSPDYAFALAAQARVALAAGDLARADASSALALARMAQAPVPGPRRVGLYLTRARVLDAMGQPARVDQSLMAADALLTGSDPWQVPEKARLVQLAAGLPEASASLRGRWCRQALLGRPAAAGQRALPFQQQLEAALSACS